MMSCGGEGIGGGMCGCPPGLPQIYSSDLGAATEARAVAERGPGERLALTVQHRRMMAAAPISSTGSSITYCSERAEQDQHNI